MDAKKQIESTIAEQLTKVASDPNTKLSRADVKPATDELMTTLGPWILNATNNEPWYTSKVIWGLIVAGIGTIAKPITHTFGTGDLIPEGSVEEIVASLATLGQFVGLGIAAYGRLSAKKSL